MIKHFLNPPNWFTSASIFCSVYAMSMLVGRPDPDAHTLIVACTLIVFAGVFDLLDGRVARLTNRFSEFGVQLDSLADLISFGVAPALIAWSWILHDMGKVGASILFFYVLCVAFRLARFNVNVAHKTWTLKGHSQGLTSTLSGGVLVCFVWVSNAYLDQVFTIRPWMIATLMVVQGLLMVSSIPYRSFRDLRRNKRARVLLAVPLAACLAAATFDPSMFLGVGAALYLGVGLVDGLVVLWYERRAIRLAEAADDEDLDVLDEEEAEA